MNAYIMLVLSFLSNPELDVKGSKKHFDPDSGDKPCGQAKVEFYINYYNNRFILYRSIYMYIVIFIICKRYKYYYISLE